VCACALLTRATCAGHLDAEVVSSLHFGGGEEDRQDEADGKKKTKREIMSELIAKSKFFKVRPSLPSTLLLLYPFLSSSLFLSFSM
jgi:hypothetical protein